MPPGTNPRPRPSGIMRPPGPRAVSSAKPTTNPPDPAANTKPASETASKIDSKTGSKTGSGTRTLSLPEELERLEQSITLTLQEIDHNFSRAHQIVTGSILPVVDRYAKGSEDVWQSSTFWKQFFEASANVSLSGYEETPGDPTGTMTETDASYVTTTDDENTVTLAHDPQQTPASVGEASSSFASPPAHHADLSGDGFLDERAGPSHHRQAGRQAHASATHTTRKREPRPSLAEYDSPYESLRRQVHGMSVAEDDSITPHTPQTAGAPRTPRDAAITETSPSSAATARRAGNSKAAMKNENDNSTAASADSEGASLSTGENTDLLLHRVLDRNYRLQATPHAAQPRLPPRSATHSVQRRQPSGTTRTPLARRAANTTAREQSTDSGANLDSSPLAEAPTLNAAVFGSPARQASKRVPGVSVLTPMKRGTAHSQQTGGNKDFALDGAQTPKATGASYEAAFDEDDDDDDDLPLGMSPPKTMQFHIPTSRLERTPAREASRRIVDDLLRSAGGLDFTDDESIRDQGHDASDERGAGNLGPFDDSPSVVRRTALEEDTF